MIAILLAAAVAGAPAAPIHIVSIIDHHGTVIDERTVKSLPDGLKQALVFAVFADGSPFRGQTMHMSVTPYTFDCASPRLYYGMSTFMTVNDEVLFTDRDNDHTGIWEPAPARSSMGRIRAWLCGSKPAPDAAPPVATLHEAETVYFNRIGRPGELGGK